MEATAKPIPYGEDESFINGIHLVPSKKIKPHRIQEAKISFECSLERIVRVTEGPDAGNLILGSVKLVHIEDQILKSENEADFLKHFDIKIFSFDTGVLKPSLNMFT